MSGPGTGRPIWSILPSSLRACLALLVAAVALPLITLAAGAVWDAYATERARAEERLQGRARGLAVLMDHEFGRAEALLRTAARSGRVGPGRTDAAADIAKAVAPELGNAWVTVSRRDGAALPSASWPTDTPPPGQAGIETIERALRTGEPAVSDLIHDARPETPLPIVVLAVPLPAALQDGSLPQALAATLGVEYLGSVLQELELPPGWIAAVLDRSGRVVARSLRPERTIGLPASDSVTRALREQEGDTGTIRGVETFEGTAAVVAFARVPRSGYVALILVPENVFTASARQALIRTLAIGIGLTVLGVGLAGVMASQITRALGSLAAPPGVMPGSRSGLAEVDEIAAKLVEAERYKNAAEETIRGSETRFRGTFEQAAVGIAHVALDGQWLRVNRRLCEILGYTESELLRLNFQHITHPDDLAIDLEHVQALLRGERERYRMQKRYIRRDGSQLWALLTVALVDPDAPGIERFFISVVEDITELKAAEAALAAGERRYRFLAETIPQIVWTARPDGQLDYFNHRWTETTSLAVDAGLGEGWGAVIHPDDLPGMRAAWAHSVATGAPYRVEHRVRAADGSWRWFRTGAAPLQDDKGRVVMWAGTAADFHDERQALEEVRLLNAALERRVAERTSQLADANAELEAFAYSVAHDLRAPLRGMQGFSKALIEDYAAVLDDTGRDYAGRIARGAAHLDDLIRDLLAYSRLAREEIRPEPVNLEAIVSGVLRNMASDVQETRSRITVERPLPFVRGHGAVLTQVISNMIANAMKFVAPGTEPRVLLRAEERGGRVRVWVEDNGIGIRPEHREKVFRVFERLHAQRAYAGTGIGLAIVKKGIERLGGAVGVESTPGQGSRFWFELAEEAGNGRA